MAQTVDAVYQGFVSTYSSLMATLGVSYTAPADWSATDIRRIVFFVVAYGIVALQNLYDAFKIDQQEALDTERNFRLADYVTIAKAFRFGFNLVGPKEEYDDTGLTASQIDAAQVVKYAAVEEPQRGLRVKLATDVNGVRTALSSIQMTAVTAYLERKKVAGTKLNITTGPPDQLALQLLVKFNPLILDEYGQRIDGTNNTPLQDALGDYLDNFEYNGRLELSELVNIMEAVDGIDFGYVITASAQYGALPFTAFADQAYTADSGYMTIISQNLQVTWEANV